MRFRTLVLTEDQYVSMTKALDNVRHLRHTRDDDNFEDNSEEELNEAEFIIDLLLELTEDD
jgi:hypothetical protein